MKHELKAFRAEVKAFDDLTGVAEAVVSVFGNIDLGGDRVVAGAFAKTLDEWAAKGDPIPVIWSHEWDDPQSHIGWVEDAAERADLGGLWVKMRFDIEENPRARQVARLLKQRRVTQFSFGYYARDFRMVTDPDGTPVRELLDIELFEVGPTLLGMNPATQLLEAASRTARDLKAGRVLSGKNEAALAEARDLIDGVLVQLAAESASTDPDAKAAADEVAEGVFVEYEGRQGRIEYVMTEGTFGVPESAYSIDASEADPAVLVRIFDDAEETEFLFGARASSVTVVPAPAPDIEDSSKAAAAQGKARAEVKVAAPEWMSENARQGLEWYAEGLGGDGLVDATIEEARDIAGGTVTDAKARKMRAWLARHMTDLDAPDADPSSDGYPSPGVVAHALWGGGSKAESERALAWAERRVAELDAEKSADEDTKDEVTGEETGSRDNTDRLPNSEWLDLLARTRHQE